MRLRLLWPIWCGLLLSTWVALKWPLVPEWVPAGMGQALRSHAYAQVPPVVFIPLVGLGVLALSGAGARWMRALGADPCGPVETLAFAAALGLGLYGTAGAVLGLAGAFTRAGLAGAFAGVVVAGLGGLGQVAGALRRLSRAAQAVAGVAPPAPTCATGETPEATEEPGPWAPLALGLTALTLGVALVKACAPPWYPDALFYHMALPRLYLDQGGFVAAPQEPINAAHPGLVQVLFALPMAWGHDELAGVISWAFLALTIAGAGLLAHAFGASGAVAMAATTAVPSLVFVGAMPLADAALGCYVTLAVHATVRACKTDDAGWARAASLCAGFALATKYQGLAPLGLIALALIGGFFQARGLTGMLKVAVPAALLAALPFAPWGVRNQRLYGCPLAPILARADAPAAERAVLAQYRADWVTHGHRARALALPVDVTFNANPDDLAAYEGEVGPLPLMLVPLAVLGLRRRFGAGLAAFVVVQGLFWTWGAREVRYLFPLVPVCAALACTRRAAAPAVVVAGVVSLLWLAGYARPGADLLWLAGGESRERYYTSLSATRDLYRACDAARGARRVMFFWEDRGYLCRAPYLPDHLIPGSSNHLLYDLPAEPAALAARFRQLGVDHLLVNRVAWTEANARGIDSTFSAALTRFLDGSRAKVLSAPGAEVELWALQEPISGR